MSLKQLLDNPSGTLSKRPFKGFLNSLKATLSSPTTYTSKLTYEDLINAESELGRTIFGPIPLGHQREFFESRKNIWIWHERSTNYLGIVSEMTIRYEVRPNGVFKKVNQEPYRKIEGAELDNFRKAARSYLNIVKTKLYS